MGSRLDVVHPAAAVQQTVAAAKHHAAHLRVVVSNPKYQCRSQRASGCRSPLHPHQREAALEQSRNGAVQRGNRQRGPRGYWIRRIKFKRHAGFRAKAVHKPQASIARPPHMAAAKWQIRSSV
jgi:hypothetical protein